MLGAPGVTEHTAEADTERAGHTCTRTTDVVYRRELRPVITTGAEIMDKVFKAT